MRIKPPFSSRKSRNAVFAALSACLGGFFPHASQAVTIYTQDFETLNASSGNGTSLNSQGGFTANSTVGVANGGGVSYSGAGGVVVDGGNNAVRLSTPSGSTNLNYASVGFQPTSGQSLYFRFTFNYFNEVNDTNVDFFRLQFGNDASASTSNYLGVQLSGGTGAATQTQTGLGVRARTTSNDSGRIAPGTNPYLTVNSTVSPVNYLVTGSLNWNGTAFNQVTMWINPSTTSGAPTDAAQYFNSATASATGDALTSLSTIVFQSGAPVGNLDTGDVLNLDNIVLGTAWSDIASVPEPGSWGLVVLGLMIGAFILRRGPLLKS